MLTDPRRAMYKSSSLAVADVYILIPPKIWCVDVVHLHIDTFVMFFFFLLNSEYGSLFYVFKLTYFCSSEIFIRLNP